LSPKYQVHRRLSNDDCTEKCIAPEAFQDLTPPSWRWQCGPCSVTKLAPPPAGDHSKPIIGTITAYNWRADLTYWNDGHGQFELPIYSTLDRDKPDFWNYVLDELLLSRVPLVLWHGRGCSDLEDSNSLDGAGLMCPRMLRSFVEAAELAGVSDEIKVGMWDDTAFYAQNLAMTKNAKIKPMDLDDEETWSLFWDHNIKIWFDTVPQKFWYLWEGKPLIVFSIFMLTISKTCKAMHRDFWTG
jgi:Domain of unknown function (DUF5010)